MRKIFVGMIGLAGLFAAGLSSIGAKATSPARPAFRSPPRPPLLASCDASLALAETN